MYFQREKRKVNKPRNISQSLGTDPLSCLGKYKETNEKVNIVILNLLKLFWIWQYHYAALHGQLYLGIPGHYVHNDKHNGGMTG